MNGSGKSSDSKSSGASSSKDSSGQSSSQDSAGAGSVPVVRGGGGFLSFLAGMTAVDACLGCKKDGKFCKFCRKSHG